METHTTSIGDLPIDNEMSDTSFPENSLRSTQNHVMDENVHHEKVRFENNPTYVQPNKSRDLTDIQKMVILSTGMFILFNEPFIKAYLVNILTVILGKYFKEDKFGSVIYGLLFGAVMYIITLLIDIPSIDF